jgi:RIP metalloprotease RseP
VAKKVGVKVERFGFGLPFGPTLLEKKIGETTICLHPILLGGYVSFPDDNPESSVPADSPRRFENRPIPQRAAIAVAGVTVNFLLGYLIMVGVFLTWGYPPQVVGVGQIVSPDAPAAKAGFQVEDVLTRINGQAITSAAAFIQIVQAHAGKPLTITIDRQGRLKNLTVTPNPQGKIGVGIAEGQTFQPSRFIHLRNPFQAFPLAYSFLAKNMALNFQAMGEVIMGKRDVRQLSGPVGIIKEGGNAMQRLGLPVGLILTALISTILAIMNILPIPMLDGGHLLFMAIEAVRRRPLKKEIQERVIQVSFAALIGLMGFVLWNDVNTHLLGR